MPGTDVPAPLTADSLLAGRYRLVRPVASGGMAAVWEGHDEVLTRSVAIKVLHPHLAADQVFQVRFRREAIAAARLSHPNVVATFDAGSAANGTAYIVMELVRGINLRQYLGDGRAVPVGLAVRIAIQIADALRHAHGAGLVHRDIKPANILLCQNEGDAIPQVKVTDFGIAKAAEGMGLDLTRTGMVLGTPKYLSPEQVEGREPDARADLYALGVVIFEMVTGDPPFAGPTDMATAMARLDRPAPRLADRFPGVSPGLDHLVGSLLARAPEDRPPSAAVVRQALASLLTVGNGDRTAAMDPATQSTGWQAAGGEGGLPPGNGATALMGGGPRSRDGGGAALAGAALVGGAGAALVGGAGAALVGGAGAGGAVGAVGASVKPAGVGPTVPVIAGPGGRGSATSGDRGRTGSGPLGSPTSAGGPGPGGHRPPVRSSRRPRRSTGPAWVVAALAVATAVVAAFVLFGNRSSPAGRPSSASAGAPAATGTPLAIRDVSVYHLERDADHAATVGYAHDGNLATMWTTDRYFGPHFAGLRHGLGLAITLNATHRHLHHLQVVSPTRGWSAQVYVAAGVPNQTALAAWGPPVDQKQGIDGTVTFNLGNRQDGAILLWITDLGPTYEAAVAELHVS